MTKGESADAVTLPQSHWTFYFMAETRGSMPYATREQKTDR